MNHMEKSFPWVMIFKSAYHFFIPRTESRLSTPATAVVLVPVRSSGRKHAAPFILSTMAAVLLGTLSSFGQEVLQPDSVVVDSLEVADAEDDMMLKTDTADYVYFVVPSEFEHVPGDDDPALIADRLACIEKTMPLTYNDRIQAFINYFTVKDRE